MRPDLEECPEGWCSDCGGPCYGDVVDTGVGAYEYFGEKGVNHQYTYLSSCCGAGILDTDPVCKNCRAKEVYDVGLCFGCYTKEQEEVEMEEKVSRKPVAGFETIYSVTHDGKVFRNTSTKPLSTSMLNSGYMSVEMWKDGLRKSVPIHVVVAEAWIRPRVLGECIRHLDGNKLNNTVGNLAIGTKSDNEKDKILHGTDNRGSRSGRAKLSEQQVLDIRAAALSGEKRKAIAERFSICERYVRTIRDGATWKHLF